MALGTWKCWEVADWCGKIFLMYGTLRPNEHLQGDQVLADLTGPYSIVWEEAPKGTRPDTHQQNGRPKALWVHHEMVQPESKSSVTWYYMTARDKEHTLHQCKTGPQCPSVETVSQGRALTIGAKRTESFT